MHGRRDLVGSGNLEQCAKGRGTFHTSAVDLHLVEGEAVDFGGRIHGNVANNMAHFAAASLASRSSLRKPSMAAATSSFFMPGSASSAAG